MCDFSVASIAMNGRITVEGNNDNKKLFFKNNAPFVSCISKINNRLIDNAEDLDIVMPMYNFVRIQ